VQYAGQLHEQRFGRGVKFGSLEALGVGVDLFPELLQRGIDFFVQGVALGGDQLFGFGRYFQLGERVTLFDGRIQETDCGPVI